MDTFPAFFPLAGRRVIIAGDGEGAEAKARLLAGSPATVTRLTGEACFDPGAYAGAGLIFVASFDAAFIARAAPAARTAGAALNVVDHPELSDFHTPAIIDRGAVVAAIGTAGAAPLLASLLRAEIETRVPPAAGRIAALLGARREALKAAFPDLAARRAFLRAMLNGPAAEAALAGDMDAAAARLDAAIAGGWSAVGRITLIAAPEAADLISVRAVRALNIADIVVVGEGAEAIVGQHARRDAEHWTADAATAGALADQARAGRLVAVTGRAIDAALGPALIALCVTVERLDPAPSPTSSPTLAP
jgi:precorrin-2 dehydrogenase/sirohydrochlorin ferrochelatase